MNFPFGTANIGFGGNTLGTYLTALLAGLVLFLVFKMLVSHWISKLEESAKKTKNDIDDLLAALLRKTMWPIFILLFLFGLISFLQVPPVYQKTANFALVILIVWQSMRILSQLIDYGLKHYIKKHRGMNKPYLNVFATFIKIVLWTIAVVLIIDNLGYDVTSLVAGMGIGGLAIALAVQNILSDLFSSLTIYLDKPFVVGDFVVVGDLRGTVKKIGLKSTRITSLEGEEIIVSNKKLTESDIKNYGKMKERRVLFSIGVVYGTSNEKLKKIPEIAKAAIGKRKNVRFDRAHFYKFNNSSLDFEIVYYVQTPDYNEYMNINQKINLDLKAELEKSKIEFAYPTQTLYIDKSS